MFTAIHKLTVAMYFTTENKVSDSRNARGAIKSKALETDNRQNDAKITLWLPSCWSIGC